jgi:hypothetical protein
MTWDDLNHILAAHRLQPPRMRLSRHGETLLVGGYTAPVACSVRAYDHPGADASAAAYAY